jgi:hypothetical protein
MDNKHVFLASNEFKNTEIIPVSRQLKNEQRIKTKCPKTIKDYNKLIHGVDRFNQKISCYTFDQKSKRNWLRLFVSFFNASIFNSFMYYNQLTQNKLLYLNYLVLVAKSLCAGTERINLGRPPSDRKRKLASPQSAVSWMVECFCLSKKHEGDVLTVAQKKYKFDQTSNALFAN